MTIISFNLTRLSGERKTTPMGQLSVSNKTNLKEVVEKPVGNQKALLFVFQHESSYEPDYAKLQVDGEVLVLSNDEEAAETIAAFKKNAVMDQPVAQRVFNNILNRVSIEALVLSKNLNLPAPFKLPRIDFQNAKAAAEPAAAKPPKAEAKTEKKSKK
jgi:hypothetical protein